MLYTPRRPSAAAALNVADFAVKVGTDLWMPFNTFNAQWAAARFADRDLRANKTFSTGEPAHNRFRVGDYTYVGEQLLAHFENGFDGWQTVRRGGQQLQPACELRGDKG